MSLKTKRLSAEISAADYIANYRQADYFLSLCRQCRNFGRRYGCPPFDYDIIERLSPYSTVRIIGEQITPPEANLPIAMAQQIMQPVINRLTNELLELETDLQGLSFGFAGGCTLCGEQTCARISGAPCRHANLVRPSLEAYGFDLQKTAEQILHTTLLWGTQNHLPPYLMLIGGIFY